MKLWIARDADGALVLYRYKPKRDEHEQLFLPQERDFFVTTLDEDVFKEITWENSPQRAELKLIVKTT